MTGQDISPCCHSSSDINKPLSWKAIAKTKTKLTFSTDDSIRRKIAWRIIPPHHSRNSKKRGGDADARMHRLKIPSLSSASVSDGMFFFLVKMNTDVRYRERATLVRCQSRISNPPISQLEVTDRLDRWRSRCQAFSVCQGLHRCDLNALHIFSCVAFFGG